MLNLPEENSARPSPWPEAKEEGTGGRRAAPEVSPRIGIPGCCGVTARSSPLGKEEVDGRLAGDGEPVFLQKFPPQRRLQRPVPFILLNDMTM